MFVGGVQAQLGTGTGGAPDLDPFKADQVDLSAEYYFGEEALFSVGLFYKDVSTFIVQQQSPETYGGVNYMVNRKVNGEGAEVEGVEVLLQFPFYFLSGALDGFGVIASYSISIRVRPIKDVAGRSLPLPGLSRNNVNFVGYYERGPISIRLAYNWRDDYLVGLSAAATGIYNSPYTDLSATMRASFARNPDPEHARFRNIARHPLGRLGSADEVAELALFLASDRAQWISGSVYPIDGGAGVTRR